MSRERDRALQDFVVSRFAGLRRSVYLMCGDWELAGDVVHTVLADLVFARPSGEADTLDRYAVRAAMDAFVGGWHRRARRRERIFAASGDAPSGDRDPAVTISVLAALNRLPPARRAVIVMRHWDAMSDREVAGVLGIRLGAVRAHETRGLAALHSSLDDLIGTVEPAPTGAPATGSRPFGPAQPCVGEASGSGLTKPAGGEENAGTSPTGEAQPAAAEGQAPRVDEPEPGADQDESPAVMPARGAR